MGTPEPTTEAAGLLQAARDALPWLRGMSGELEAARALPQPVADRLAAAGLHRMLTPRAYGGIETDVATFIRVTELLAQGNASAAWCTFISCTSAVVGAWLPPEQARQLFASPGVIGAGVFAPRGTALPETRDGIEGYRVNGRWSWGSGCLNAHYFSGGCLVRLPDGQTQALPDGTPLVLSVVFDRADVTVHDTWHAMGLRATGSNDFEVQDLFVPRARTASLMSGTPLDRPLYQFPAFGLLSLGIAAVALGVGRVAIDALCELAGAKLPQGSSRPLAQRPSTQEQVAHAEARLRAARAWLFETVDSAWTAAVTNGAITVDHRRDLRLAACHAVREVSGLVDQMHRIAGGSSVFVGSPLEHCLRDAHVITQHMMVGDTLREQTGRLFLGLHTQTATL